MARKQFFFLTLKNSFFSGAQVDPDVENPLDKMSEEEKELEAEKLANLLSKLNEKGLVKPALIGPDGKPVDINPEDD
jgi:hypothetical protein